MTRERRAWPRASCRPEPCGRGAHIRPGRQVHVLDLSRGGALIESRARLAPASNVELRFTDTDRRVQIRGRVVRSYVSALNASSVWYRSGIVFEEQMNPTQFEHVRTDGPG